MRDLKLFLLGLRRLFGCRRVWLAVLVTVLSPLAGLTFFKTASADTMLSGYLANPAIAGGAVSAVVFGLLIIYELDRPVRSRAEAIINSAVSPVRASALDVSALLAASVIAFALTAAVWLPITAALAGDAFDINDYLPAYAIFMGLALPCAVFAAAACVNFTHKAAPAAVIFAAFAALGLTAWADDWQLCWTAPSVWALSDDFSNHRIFRSAAYMRLTWAAALCGAWMMSCCCIRRYGKGFFGSFLVGIRRVYLPAAAALMLASACAAYAFQPFVDDSVPDESAVLFSELEYLDGVVCSGRTAEVLPDTDAGTVSGRACYVFENGSGRSQTAAFGIDPGYTVYSVKANGEEVPFSVGDRQEFNEAMLEVELPAAEHTELTVEYGGFPRESRNMSDMQGGKEISGEYICLENSALAPRLMNVMPDEGLYPADIEITLPEGMTLVPFCAAKAEIRSRNGDGTVTWGYRDNGTGGILYAGDYVCEKIEAGGIVIELYYARGHESVMSSAGAADAVRAVAEYCTEHYGALSFGTGDTLKLIESRVLGGGYATDGASLLDETDLTAANLGDSGKGAAPREVMIHELVHQWWGLSCMFDDTDEASPWSAEGLTVYTTYRIAKELYGADYAERYYIEQWKKELGDYRLNFYVRRPEYLEKLPEDIRAEVTGGLSYARRYCEMPLKLLKAEELVGGEAELDRILSGLFTRELDPYSPYLTYQDLLDACGLREEELELD